MLPLYSRNLATAEAHRAELERRALIASALRRAAVAAALATLALAATRQALADDSCPSHAWRLALARLEAWPNKGGVCWYAGPAGGYAYLATTAPACPPCLTPPLPPPPEVTQDPPPAEPAP